MENCYFGGAVSKTGLISVNDHNAGYLFGAIVGTTVGTPSISYCYGLNDETLPFELVGGHEYDIYCENCEPTITNTVAFERNANENVLLDNVIIGKNQYSDLLSALNAWVDANNADGLYLHWAPDTANVNGGFPILAKEVIAAAETNNTEVTAKTTPENSVILEWPEVEDAATYTIEIRKGSTLVCTLVFDSQGRLLSVDYATAPSRNGKNRDKKSATQITHGWQYVVEGLDPDTEYTYTITAKKQDATVVFTQTVTFNTYATAFEITNDPSPITNKIIKDNQLLILRGDKVYTITGQEVK